MKSRFLISRKSGKLEFGEKTVDFGRNIHQKLQFAVGGKEHVLFIELSLKFDPDTVKHS